MAALRRIAVVVSFVLCASVLLAPSPAAGLSPVVDALQINAPSPYWQIDPATVAAGDGFLAVWEDMRHGIVGRAVAADGTPVGDEIVFAANTPFPDGGGWVPYTRNLHASAVSLPGGDVLLVWTRQQGDLSYGWFQHEFRVDSTAIVAQRFSAAGAAVSDVFAVSGPGAGSVEQAATALTADGDVAVVWQAAHGKADAHLAGRVLDFGEGLAAAAARPVIRVTDGSDLEPSGPAVVAGEEGGFLVAWTGLDASEAGVFARHYGADGLPSGKSVRVNQAEQLSQAGVSAVRAGDGGFLVGWQNEVVSGVEYRAFGRFLDAQGRPAGDERRLSIDVEVTNGESVGESKVSLAALPAGGYQLFWVGWFQGKAAWVLGLELDADAAPAGDVLEVSSERPRSQARPAVALGDGNALVVWEGKDGRGWGVTGRAFALPAVEEVAAEPEPESSNVGVATAILLF